MTPKDCHHPRWNEETGIGSRPFWYCPTCGYVLHEDPRGEADEERETDP